MPAIWVNSMEGGITGSISDKLDYLSKYDKLRTMKKVSERGWSNNFFVLGWGARDLISSHQRSEGKENEDE